MKIHVHSRGETTIDADTEYQEPMIREAIDQRGDVASVIIDYTDSERSDISHDEYAIVTEDDGAPLWSGWLTGDADAPAPAEVTPGTADGLLDWAAQLISRATGPEAQDWLSAYRAMSPAETVADGPESTPVPLPTGIALAALECIRQEYGAGTMAHDTAHKALDDYFAARRSQSEPPSPGPQPVPAGTDRTAATTETGSGSESVSEPQTTSGGGEWVPVLSVLENVHLHALIAVSGEPLKVRIVNGAGGGSVDMTFAQWTAFASTIGEELVKLLPAPALAQLSASQAHRSGSDWPDRGAAENAL